MFFLSFVISINNQLLVYAMMLKRYAHFLLTNFVISGA
jgi:hypothetical protein